MDMLFINKILMEWMRIGAKANISLGFLYLDKKFAEFVILRKKIVAFDRKIHIFLST